MITPFDHFDTAQDNDVSFHGASSDDIITLGQAMPTRAFGYHSTTDEVLDGRRPQRQARAGDRRLGRARRRDRPRAGRARRQVVGAARDLAKAEARDRAVRAEAANGGGLELVELDLAVAGQRARLRRRPDRRRASRSTWSSPTPASWRRPFGKTADGFETQFGTNHLGHFVLVNRIASLIEAGGAAGEPVLVRPPLLRRRPRRPELRDARPTPSSAPTAARRPPTSCSPSSSTAATRPAACAPRPCIPGGIQTELGRHMTPDALPKR